MLMSLHIFSYLVQFFRSYEIAKKGKPDPNGVMRAPCETLILQIELLTSSVLFGYIINYFLGLDRQYVHSNAFLNYWLGIDSIMLLLTHFYIYLSEFL
jgi:hypothetical protein